MTAESARSVGSNRGGWRLQKSVHNRAADIWLMAAVMLIPALYSPSTLDPALPIKFVSLAVLVGLGSVLHCLPGEQGLWRGFRAPHLAFLLYTLFSIVSVGAAGNRSEAVFDVSRTLLVLSFLILATSILSAHPNRVGLVVRATILSALAHSVVGLLQYTGTGFEFIPGNHVIFSTLANKNLFSSFLLLTVAFQLFGIGTLNGAWRWTAWATLQVTALALALAQTRAVWLGILLSTIALTGLGAAGSGALRSRLRRIRFAGVVSVLVFASGVVIVSDTGLVNAISRSHLPVSTVRERIALWSRTIEMIAERPWLGVGPGNWKFHVVEYGVAGMRSESGEVHFQRPHNDLLWVISESGVVAGILLGAFYLSSLYAAARNARGPQEDGRLSLLSACIVFGLISYVVVAIVSFPRERIEHSILASLLVACLSVAPPGLWDRDWFLPQARRIAGSIPLFVVAVACVYLGLLRFSAEIHTVRAMMARDRGSWMEVVSEIREGESWAANVDPAGTPLAFYEGVAWFSTGKLKEARAAFRRAMKHNPNHIHVLNNLGSTWDGLGESEAALASYRRALEISPHFQEALLNSAAIHFNRGELSIAHDLVEACPDSESPRLQQFREAIRRRREGGSVQSDLPR